MNSVTNFLNYQPNCFLFHTFCKKHPLRCEIDEKECEDYRRYINYQLKKRLDFPAEEPDLYFDIVPEMESFAKKYVENILFVMEGIRSCSNNVMVYIEQPVDFSRWIPGGTGLVDCVIISDDFLSITVYEHNRNIRVPVENNSKLILYALGILEHFDSQHRIKRINMNVFQPYFHYFSGIDANRESLFYMADRLASKKKPVRIPAYAACRFCEAKPVCEKLLALLGE